MSPLLWSIWGADIGVVETTVMIEGIVEIIEIAVAVIAAIDVTVREITVVTNTTKIQRDQLS
jgi:hypothetical protein